MAILIEGMEMPKGRDIVVVRSDGFAGYIAVNPKDAYTGKAISVSEPHGRLIDADALGHKIREYTEEYGDIDENGWHSDKWCAMQEAKIAIEDAPTIIPASEEGL